MFDQTGRVDFIFKDEDSKTIKTCAMLYHVMLVCGRSSLSDLECCSMRRTSDRAAGSSGSLLGRWVSQPVAHPSPYIKVPLTN